MLVAVAAGVALEKKAAAAATISDAEFKGFAMEHGMNISKLPLSGKEAKDLIDGAKADGLTIDTDADGKLSKKELKASIVAFKKAHPEQFPAAPVAAAKKAEKAAAKVTVSDAELATHAKHMHIDLKKLPLTGAAAKGLIADTKAHLGISIDSNSDGKVGKEELRTALVAFKKKHPEEFKAQKAAAVTVSDAELTAACAEMHIDIAKLPITGALATALIADTKKHLGISIDANKDGKVGKEELRAGLASFKAKNP